MVLQRPIVCEQDIIGPVATIRAYILYIVLQHVSALYDHHLVRQLHSLSTLFLFSLTLAKFYNWEMSYLLFFNANMNVYMYNTKTLKQ
jgi:hypothetical protein